MWTATKIEQILREADSPTAAAHKLLELLGDGEASASAVQPQHGDRLIPGHLTGLVIEGLLLKLYELEKLLVVEANFENALWNAWELDRDRCIEAILQVYGSGGEHLAQEAIAAEQDRADESPAFRAWMKKALRQMVLAGKSVAGLHVAWFRLQFRMGMDPKDAALMYSNETIPRP